MSWLASFGDARTDGQTPLRFSSRDCENEFNCINLTRRKVRLSSTFLPTSALFREMALHVGRDLKTLGSDVCAHSGQNNTATFGSEKEEKKPEEVKKEVEEMPKSELKVEKTAEDAKEGANKKSERKQLMKPMQRTQESTPQKFAGFGINRGGRQKQGATER